ncbi:MAG: hypothetical protein Kow0080_12430 [Candidatus Promineifilaceae bacterium]
MFDQPSPVFFIGILVSNVGATIGLAMAVLVLWQSRTARINRLMAAYAMTVFLWGVGGVVMRMAMLFGREPTFLFYVNALLMGLSGYILLWFATAVTGVERAAWVRVAKWVGALLAVGLFVVASLRGDSNVTFLPDGRFLVHVRLIPVIVIALLYVYYIAAFTILWQHRHLGTDYLVIGGLIGVVGVGSTLFFPQIQSVLPPIGFVALSSVFFVRAILNEQLFHPLRRLNAQLQASEERYRLLSNLTSDYAYKIVFTEDGRFHFEWLTEAFTRITGYTATELETAQNWASFVHPDDVDIIQAIDAQMLAGEVVEGEYRIITKNHETIWILEHRRPVLGEDGRLQSLTGAAKDITKRKITELALQDSEAKHRLLLDNIRLPVLALEPDMTIYYCNSAYAHFVGISIQELEGQNLLELFPNFQNRKSYQVYQQVLKTGVPSQVEGAFGERVMLAQIFPAPWGLLSVADDITDRKIAEEALAMSRMKTELLAKVGHELRTPLGAILGYAEMLHHGTRGSVTDEQKKMLKRIMVNTEKLIDNVNAMLDEAQIELGTLKLNIVDFSPQALLDSMHATLDRKAAAKKIQFTSEVDDNMPPFVTADFQRLEQVLINLADNAIKFTETGGVHVRIARQDETHWQIVVSDTGIGISETAQMYIFDAFRQVDGSPTRTHDGVGLGLSIVKQLVTLMDGTIDVKSAPGDGATFTVVMPLVTIQEQEYE